MLVAVPAESMPSAFHARIACEPSFASNERVDTSLQQWQTGVSKIPPSFLSSRKYCVALRKLCDCADAAIRPSASRESFDPCIVGLQGWLENTDVNWRLPFNCLGRYDASHRPPAHVFQFVPTFLWLHGDVQIAQATSFGVQPFLHCHFHETAAHW